MNKPLSTSPPKGRRQRSIRLFNTSSVKLNAWSVCQFVSGNPLKMRDGEPTWDVEIVTDDGANAADPWRFVFLLDRPIPPGKPGLGTQDWPVLTRGVDTRGSTTGLHILVDGEVVRTGQMPTLSPKAGSQSLDGFGNVFAQLAPLGNPKDYGTKTLRYVAPVFGNHPSPMTIGGEGDGVAESGAAFEFSVERGYSPSVNEGRAWFRRSGEGEGVSPGVEYTTNPVRFDTPGWYSLQFTSRVSASIDVAGIVSLGVRFSLDDGTYTDEYTQADHQPVSFPTSTNAGGSPSHSHVIDYKGGTVYGEALVVNPNIWLGLTILHRFTEPGSFHFRNFGLLDVTLQEFYWTATYRGPHHA